jgi:hypothetical protein
MSKSKRYAVSADGEQVVNTHTGRTVALPKLVEKQIGHPAAGKVGRQEAVRDFVAEKNYR